MNRKGCIDRVALILFLFAALIIGGFITIAELLMLPPAQPIDVQEAYYRGKIDGIKECTAKIKKVNKEFAKDREALRGEV